MFSTQVSAAETQVGHLDCISMKLFNEQILFAESGSDILTACFEFKNESINSFFFLTAEII